MTKDEMKNRISMALKDPILQQGFEIICKEKVELEQTNNNLLDVINNQDVKIVDLEKQIVEYKNGNFVQTVNQIIEGKDKQIEKMKCCAKCSHCNTHITTCIPQKRFVKLEDVCKDFELRR